MNKPSLLSLLRLVLTAAGSYLIGRSLFGNQIDSVIWNEITGALLTAAGVIWGIVDKTATVEMIQSGVRSVLIVVGGILVASGKIKEEVLTSILGIVAIIVPWILSGLARKKVDDLKTGKVQLTDLKGSKPNVV